MCLVDDCGFFLVCMYERERESSGYDCSGDGDHVQQLSLGSFWGLGMVILVECLGLDSGVFGCLNYVCWVWVEKVGSIVGEGC